MEVYDAMRKRIRELLEEKNMSVVGLERAAGLSKGKLQKFMCGKTEKIRSGDFFDICDAWDISPSDFLNSEYFNKHD